MKRFEKKSLYLQLRAFNYLWPDRMLCYNFNMKNEVARVHVFVSGRVQGVAFRYYAVKWAKELELTGWIRNLDDGRIESLAEGEKSKLEKYLDFLKTGPRLARVDQVEIDWQQYKGEFADFQIIFSCW